MAGRHPAALPESTTVDRVTVDRTGTMVAGGLTLMAFIGVATVFSDALAAAWSPASAAGSAAPEPAVTSTLTPGVAPAAGPPGMPSGGGSDAGTAQP
jgi:hypothetical protein